MTIKINGATPHFEIITLECDYASFTNTHAAADPRRIQISCNAVVRCRLDFPEIISQLKIFQRLDVQVQPQFTLRHRWSCQCLAITH